MTHCTEGGIPTDWVKSDLLETTPRVVRLVNCHADNPTDWVKSDLLETLPLSQGARLWGKTHNPTDWVKSDLLETLGKRKDLLKGPQPYRLGKIGFVGNFLQRIR